MKLNHWSARYHALQRVDPVNGVKRNLRPFQVQAALMKTDKMSVPRRTASGN